MALLVGCALASSQDVNIRLQRLSSDLKEAESLIAGTVPSCLPNETKIVFEKPAMCVEGCVQTKFWTNNDKAKKIGIKAAATGNKQECKARGFKKFYTERNDVFVGTREKVPTMVFKK